MNEKTPNKNRMRETLIRNKKTPNKILIMGILLLSLIECVSLAPPVRAIGVFDPDVSVKINGLVCHTCGMGVKKIFQKHLYVKELKMNTKKQILLLEYYSIEIHPSEIKSMVKNAGYKVASIKWLKKKEPNRYNRP